MSHVFTCKQLIDNLLTSPVLCLRLSACSLGVISLFRCVSLRYSPQLRCFFFATVKQLCSQEAWTQTQFLMQGPCRNGLCDLFLPCPFQPPPKIRVGDTSVSNKGGHSLLFSQKYWKMVVNFPLSPSWIVGCILLIRIQPQHLGLMFPSWFFSLPYLDALHSSSDAPWGWQWQHRRKSK